MMTDPVALGPDTLLWRYLGDWRYMLTASRWGALQSLDPAFGDAAVTQSTIFSEPLDRLLRSMPPILGVVYDGPDAANTARWVVEQHLDIKGTDQNGKRYHALNPDTFYWAHATFVDCLVAMIDTFDHRLSSAELEQLYAESCAWWRLYGLSDRPMPPTWPRFRDYFDSYCVEVLESTEGFRKAVRMGADAARLPQSSMPPILYRVGAKSAVHTGNLLMRGLLPPVVRETAELPWSRADQRQLDLIATTVRTSWPLVPMRLRYQQRARAAFDRTDRWPSRRGPLVTAAPRRPR